MLSSSAPSIYINAAVQMASEAAIAEEAAAAAEVSSSSSLGPTITILGGSPELRKHHLTQW